MKHGWAPPTVVLSSNLRQVRRKECEFGAHDRERASGPFAAGSSGLYFFIFAFEFGQNWARLNKGLTEQVVSRQTPSHQRQPQGRILDALITLLARLASFRDSTRACLHSALARRQKVRGSVHPALRRAFRNKETAEASEADLRHWSGLATRDS